MNVKVRRNKKSLTISIKAGVHPEGVDLKDAVLAAAGAVDYGGLSPQAILNELKARGYTGDFAHATERTITAVLTKKAAL